MKKIISLFLLCALLACGSQSGDDSTNLPGLRVPIKLDSNGWDILIPATINGVPVECLFDTGANAPVNAIWVQMQWAEANGIQLNLFDDGTHWAMLAQVDAGPYSRSDVYSYVFSETWYGRECLIGLSLFQGYSRFEIDLTTNELILLQ